MHPYASVSYDACVCVRIMHAHVCVFALQCCGDAIYMYVERGGGAREREKVKDRAGSTALYVDIPLSTLVRH